MIQTLATTLVVASLYALLGAGYVLVYRSSRVLNLAQGDLLTLGGYFLFALAAAFPGAPAVSLGDVSQLQVGQNVFAIGNGHNDRMMLDASAVGVALVQAEGGAAETLGAADVVAVSIIDALNLLRFPKRLVATLRS